MFVDVFKSYGDKEWIRFDGIETTSLKESKTTMPLEDIYLTVYDKHVPIDDDRDEYVLINKHSKERYIIRMETFCDIQNTLEYASRNGAPYKRSLSK